jgi:1-acyl-sn-glycerol-3-phosphate acyltransferase
MIGTPVATICRLMCGTSVQWCCDPHETRPRIYFANHSSHLDFVVIWSSLPARARTLARPVAARDYWMRSAIRRYLAADVFNAVFVERQHAASAGRAAHGAVGRAAYGAVGRASRSRPGIVPCSVAAARAATASIAAEMGDHHSLILFPEGTRSADGQVAAFKSGLYFLSQVRPDVELIPVFLANLNRMLPGGEALPVPMLSRASFGPPLPRVTGEDKSQFLDRARRAVIELGARYGSEC